MLREKVENQKRLYLYNLNSASPKIEDQIVEAIAQYVLSAESENIYTGEDMLAQLITYLEFGLDYEKHQSLFALFLMSEHLSKDGLMSYVRKNQMKVPLTKRAIAKNLFWIKSKHSDTIAMNKAEAVDYIYQQCNIKKIGIYFLKDAVSEYELVISRDEMHLTNNTKGISYIICNDISL